MYVNKNVLPEIHHLTIADCNMWKILWYKCDIAVMILVNILIQIHISISLAADADFKQIMEMQVKFLMTIHSLPGFSAQHKCRFSLWQLIESEFHRVFFSFRHIYSPLQRNAKYAAAIIAAAHQSLL